MRTRVLSAHPSATPDRLALGVSLADLEGTVRSTQWLIAQETIRRFVTTDDGLALMVALQSRPDGTALPVRDALAIVTDLGEPAPRMVELVHQALTGDYEDAYGFVATFDAARTADRWISVHSRETGAPHPFEPTLSAATLELRCVPADPGTPIELLPPYVEPFTCTDPIELVQRSRQGDDGRYRARVRAAVWRLLSSCSAYSGSYGAALRLTPDRSGPWTVLARGSLLWSLEARRTCDDRATSIVCDPLLDFHAVDPFGPPREIRFDATLGEPVSIVVTGCGGDRCEWDVTAIPPAATGGACDAERACEPGAVCQRNAGAVEGVCVVATPPTLETAVAFRDGGTFLARVNGLDDTRDARELSVEMLDAAGTSLGPATILSGDGERSSTAFTMRVRAPLFGLATAASARLVAIDAAGLRSAPMVRPIDDVPLRGANEVCDSYSIESLCGRGLLCTDVGGGSYLCR